MYYDTLPQETVDFIRSYRDHISLAAGEGEPLATAIYTAHSAFILNAADAPLTHDTAARDSAQAWFIGAVDAYRDATNAAPTCDCGNDHTMPNYRVCHPCRLGRMIYPHLFEICPPDALFEAVQS